MQHGAPSVVVDRSSEVDALVGAGDFGDASSRGLRQLVHVDEVLVRLCHRLHDFGAHAASADDGRVLVAREMRLDA